MLNRALLILVLAAALAVGVFILRTRGPLLSELKKEHTAAVPVVQTSMSDAFVLKDALPELEFADTDKERIRGLSGREQISLKAGLFFIFDHSDMYGIWMKDMEFAIDIIWLDDNGSVVGVQEGAIPESFPTVFYPDAPARYVLETNAGFAQTHALAKGDSVILPDPQTY